MLPDLHTNFSRGRSGDLVFPSLTEFSTVYCNLRAYDYTVKLRNRFKGLDLIDRVPEELWTETCDIVQETVIKTMH